MKDEKWQMKFEREKIKYEASNTKRQKERLKMKDDDSITGKIFRNLQNFCKHFNLLLL